MTLSSISLVPFSVQAAETTAPPAAGGRYRRGAADGVLLVDCDGVGEGVRLGGGDWRDVVLEAVDGCDDLHDCRQEGRLHGLADLCSFCVLEWRLENLVPQIIRLCVCVWERTHHSPSSAPRP